MVEVKDYLSEIIEAFFNTIKYYIKIGLPLWGVVSFLVTFYFSTRIEGFGEFLPFWGKTFALLFLSVFFTLVLLTAFLVTICILFYFLLFLMRKVINYLNEKWD